MALRPVGRLIDGAWSVVLPASPFRYSFLLLLCSELSSSDVDAIERIGTEVCSPCHDGLLPQHWSILVGRRRANEWLGRWMGPLALESNVKCTEIYSDQSSEH